ncbi:MAG: SMC family ATPase [Candidatus Bathyarchaeia archaeon]|jgi:DNA repair exonuclease SbcCD ATPase subunit
MQLHKLHLRNFCQHQDLTVNFEPGLNLILGPNGAGKSNLIEAIQFAITGDLQNHTREEAICQNASDNETSSVTLDFQHLDYTVCVRRSIRPTTHTLTCVMHSGDYTATIEGYSEVNKYLLELLDVQKKQLEDYVFIAQGSLDALINKPKEQRTLELAKVFGVADTERIWEALGTKLTKIEVPVAPDLVKLEAECHRLRTEAAAINKQMCDLSAVKLDEELVSHFNEELVLRKEYETNLIKYYKLRDTLTTLEQNLKHYACLPEDQHDIEKLKLAKYSAECEADIARDILKEWAAYAQYQRQLNTLVVQQEKLEKTIRERVPVYKGYSQNLKCAKEKLEVLKADLSIYQSNIAAARCSIRSAVCVTCKRPFDNYEQIKESLAALEQQEQQLITAIAPLQTAMDIWQIRQHVYVAINSYRNALNNIQTVPLPEKSEKECERIVREIEIINIDLKQAQEYFNTQSLKEAELRGSYNSIKEQLLTIEQSLLNNPVINRRQYNEITTALKDYNIHKAQETELININKQKQFELSRVQTEFDNAITLVDQRQKLLTAREYLVSLRELFHRSGLPKIMIEAYIDIIASDVNEFLTIFDAPFKVKRGEHLGFDAVFANNSTVISDKLLSGGQKVILSLAFRVALNSRFTTTLGLLSLDEPTVHLDKETRACMPIMLERLRELCKLKNIQVLFITHDDDLFNLGDNIIQLGAANV